MRDFFEFESSTLLDHRRHFFFLDWKPPRKEVILGISEDSSGIDYIDMKFSTNNPYAQ